MNISMDITRAHTTHNRTAIAIAAIALNNKKHGSLSAVATVAVVVIVLLFCTFNYQYGNRSFFFSLVFIFDLVRFGQTIISMGRTNTNNNLI